MRDVASNKKTMQKQLIETIQKALSPYYPISRETAGNLSHHTQQKYFEFGELVEKENQLIF